MRDYRHWESRRARVFEDEPPIRPVELRDPPPRPSSHRWQDDLETALNWLAFWAFVGICAYIDITTPGGWP